MIPDEIVIKYCGVSRSEYANDEDFYQSFLIATDHIPNKIVESFVLVLHDSTALNMIPNLVSWVSTIYNDYADVISYREICRTEYSKILEGAE